MPEYNEIKYSTIQSKKQIRLYCQYVKNLQDNTAIQQWVIYRTGMRMLVKSAKQLEINEGLKLEKTLKSDILINCGYCYLCRVCKTHNKKDTVYE